MQAALRGSLPKISKLLETVLNIQEKLVGLSLGKLVVYMHFEFRQKYFGLLSKSGTERCPDSMSRGPSASVSVWFAPG
jgi:hypothetical protein